MEAARDSRGCQDTRDEQITRLLCERNNLEYHAMELKHQLFHTKRALGATQERIRRVKVRVQQVRRRRPVLRLVVSTDPASGTAVLRTNAVGEAASRIDDTGKVIS